MISSSNLNKDINNLPSAIATPLLVCKQEEEIYFNPAISSSPGIAPISSNSYPSQSTSAGQFVLDKNLQKLNEDQILELADHGYTRGMIKCLEQTKHNIALRIWIIDNSGSMLDNDGHQIMEYNNTTKVVPCSRWTELRDTVSHQIQLASIIGTPTSFRLLNDPGVRVGSQKFGICFGGDKHSKQEEVRIANDVMSKVDPRGATPLTSHVNNIYCEIKSNEAYLRNSGKRVSIVIATDGLPTDSNGVIGLHAHQDFRNALRQLEGLPVCILIRLCTNDENVAAFYNDLDKQLELPIEVLDDFVSEAKEVHDMNPWLNYGLPLHRLREIGTKIRLLDFLDEHRFSISEIRDFMPLLFGNTNMENAPDPNFEFSQYSKFIQCNILSKEKVCWNPMTSKMKPWINMKHLTRIYGKSLSITNLLNPRLWLNKRRISHCH